MAYSTPPTWSPDTIVASSDLQILSDDIAYLKAQTDQAVLSGVQATRTSTQSIPNTTATEISFTTETFDQGGWIAVTATTFTVPSSAIPAGFTRVLLDVRVGTNFATNTAGYRQVSVKQNGSSILAPTRDAISTTSTNVNESRFTTAVAGDTFTVEAYQNSGGALNIISAYLSLTVDRAID